MLFESADLKCETEREERTIDSKAPKLNGTLTLVLEDHGVFFDSHHFVSDFLILLWVTPDFFHSSREDFSSREGLRILIYDKI